MTNIGDAFVMRVPTGMYLAMKTISSHIGYRYEFYETFDLSKAETLSYPRVYSLPFKARAILNRNYPDVEFVRVEITRTIKLKD
jgi:hypothetical protein